MEPRIVALPGGPLALVEEGQGTPLILLHGLPGSHRDHRHLSPLLTHRFRVLRPDLPGFGLSPLGDPAQLSPEGRAETIGQLCRALSLDRVLLLGHSMGGVAALAAVSAAPDHFAGLVLLSSPGLRPHRALRDTPAGLLRGGLARPWLRPLLLPLLRRAFAQAGFRRVTDLDLVHTIEALTRLDLGAHADRARACRRPTMVAWCADDPLVEEHLIGELAAVCPAGPRLRWLTGGHNPQKSQAPALAAALIDWADALRV